MSASIRGFILDYGEVICHRPTPQQIARLASATGLDLDTFAARYQEDRGLYDRGDLSLAEYWSRVISPSVVLSDTLIEQLRQWDVDMWSDVDCDMIDWLAALRDAGFKTALLSNMHADMALKLRGSFEWPRQLDYVVLSCEVRLIKPDPAIYQRCVAGLQLAPAETCFIDDRQVNVDAARGTGLTALLFQGIARLRNDLIQLGTSVLPEDSAR